MHFDKAYIIGLPNHTNKRLDRCFKRFKREKVDVELWEGIYGLDVDINKYQKAGYLSKDFKLKLPGSLGCMLSHISSNCEIVNVVWNGNFIIIVIIALI